MVCYMVNICTLLAIFLCDDTQLQKLHYDPILSASGHRGRGLCCRKQHLENFAR